MTRQIFIGLITEGKTDIRFLDSIVKRTFEEIAFECYGEFEIVLSPININKPGLGFVEFVIEASKKGVKEYGIMILCVHKDADDSSDNVVFKNCIIPAQNALLNLNEAEFCRILTAVVPVQMIESWMMADKEILKREIGTSKSDEELGINREPETFADPKKRIADAIRIARKEVTRRRRKELSISELYAPIGQKTSIEKLDKLPSYTKFKEAVREAYRKLNYL